jgi:hypothetical protein
LISFYSGKTIHTFTGSGTFINTSGSPLSVDYVAVASGGAGGNNAGGGGGAGGVLSNIPGFMPGTTAIPAVGTGTPNAVTRQWRFRYRNHRISFIRRPVI